MDKGRLGRTGLMVSRLGFGSIPIQRLSEEDAIAVIHRCLELGINFLDTANGYTTSEERIGKAIAGRREGLIIGTKTLDRTPQGIANHLKLSLARLQVESIDLYQFHNVSDMETLNKIIAPGGLLTVVAEAKKAGKVKHIGITSHQIDAAREAIKSGCFETIMFPFNFITREDGEELLKLAREFDVGFIAMKPLSGGMLSDATLAFKYLLQFPDVVPIPGIERVEEIEEIVRIVATSEPLTAAEQAEMERLRQELGNRFCRRCDYCQPCGEGIPISMVLQIESLFKRVPVADFFNRFGSQMEKALDCIQCGDCEARCPYGLPIMEMMEEYGNFYQMEKGKYQEQMASR